MNKGILRSIVCRGFCSFYKNGKNESPKCGTYDFLAENLSTDELREAALAAIRHMDYSLDKEIRHMICERCAFFADGCDFRRSRRSPPCGGYIIIERLFKQRYQ
jgi:hypothetical protein